MYYIVLVMSFLATVWSLYYWWFWDPVLNIQTWEYFLWSNAYPPCELCWFARVLMYPILIIALLWWKKKSFDTVLVLVLSWLWILLETYQYWFQMTKSEGEVQSVICWLDPGSSCAATEVIYWWFITVPFLCLVAFITIFIATLRKHKQMRMKTNKEDLL